MALFQAFLAVSAIHRPNSDCTTENRPVRAPYAAVVKLSPPALGLGGWLDS